jgi:hypothetical protein
MSVNYDPEVRVSTNVIILVDYSGDVVYINERQYDPLVTDLEAKARELWPHKFEAYNLPDPQFVKVEMAGNKPYELKHFDEAITACVEQVLGLNEVIELDKKLREQQIPLNSKKHEL